jgi:hypothetical protein
VVELLLMGVMVRVGALALFVLEFFLLSLLDEVMTQGPPYESGPYVTKRSAMPLV